MRTSAVLLACLFVAMCCGSAAAPASPPARPWLFLSDVHYDTFADRAKPANVYAADTNPRLLDSFFAEAERVAPNPPVVVIAGDFIAHDARRADEASTMAYLARRFKAAFPHAQFVITLGNNDSSCGDYAPPIDGGFLTAVARAWAPLVNVRRAAPNFLRTFAHDGSYVATLPVPKLRAVVINDNFFTVRYAARCAPKAAPGNELAAFRSALASGPPGSRTWVLFHVPPGIDAFSTSHLTHGLVVVPFLRPAARDALTSTIADPHAHVALAIAGHTHKFAFRVIGNGPGGGVPMLLVPSISPIFKNYPSFLTAPVATNGTLGNVVQYGFDGHAWSRLGDLAQLGVPQFLAPHLRTLQQQLLTGAAHRELFASLYEGGADPEIATRTWGVYACATTQFTDASFERCTGKSGYSILTRRGVAVGFAGAVASTIVIATVYLFKRRRRTEIAATRVEGEAP